MIEIQIENQTGWKLPEEEAKLRESIQKIISHLTSLQSYEISLMILNDEEIRAYNREYRQKDKPTDVLSFPLSIDFNLPHLILGEVLISYETLQRQALEVGHSEREEFYRLLVHGILHLLGYDHEISPEEERNIRRIGRLRAVCYGNPGG